MRWGIVVLAVALSSSLVRAADVKTPPTAKIDLSTNEIEVAEREKGARVEIIVSNRVPTAIYQKADKEEIAAPLDPATIDKDPADPCDDVKTFLQNALKSADEEAKVKTAVESAGRKVAGCKPERQAAFEAEVDRLTTIHLAYTVPASGDLPVTLTRGDKKWSVILRPKKTAEEAAAEKAASAALKRIESLGPARDVTVKKCSWATGCSDDPIFINADHVAVLYIDNVPRSKMTVRVTAGEHSDCEALDFNYHQFTNFHDQIAIPLHMRSPGWEWFRGVNARRETYGLQLYGLISPIQVEVTDKKTGQTQQSARVLRRPDAATRDVLCTRTTAAAKAETSYVNVSGIDMPSVPLLLRGKSELVTVEVSDGDDGAYHQTFNAHIAYQRFWLDAGGFFAFSRETNDDLIKDPPTTDGGKATVKVTQIRTIRDLNPATGIVINIHPGNIPYLAAQFGIAAQQQRQPSYYFGGGVRLREIGKRSLATLAAGLAAVQTTTFPGLTAVPKDANGNRVVPADSPLLTGHTQYHFEPYFSISLGFSFGGVSEGADVTRAVSSPQ